MNQAVGAPPVDAQVFNAYPNVCALAPVWKRTKEVSGSLATGAVLGYTGYWIIRILDSVGIVDSNGQTLYPLPFVLSGVSSQAVLESARLTHEAQMALLGERERYADSQTTSHHTALDKFRKVCWDGIGKLSRLRDQGDTLFSRFFSIRTAKEIHKRKMEDNDLYLLEITRRAFWEQASETISTAVPQELGVYIVEGLGYDVLGGHLGWLHGLSFVSGVMLKVHNVYKKIDSERTQAAEQIREDKELENRVDYLILMAYSMDKKTVRTCIINY